MNTQPTARLERLRTNIADARSYRAPLGNWFSSIDDEDQWKAGGSRQRIITMSSSTGNDSEKIYKSFLYFLTELPNDLTFEVCISSPSKAASRGPFVSVCLRIKRASFIEHAGGISGYRIPKPLIGRVEPDSDLVPTLLRRDLRRSLA